MAQFDRFRGNNRCFGHRGARRLERLASFYDPSSAAFQEGMNLVTFPLRDQQGFRIILRWQARDFQRPSLDGEDDDL